jgi:hypothetical protein
VRSHDVVESERILERGRESAVHAIDAALDECCEWETIKDGEELIPEFLIIILDTVVAKAINLSHLFRFVIAAQQEDLPGKHHFHAQQQHKSLNRILPAVDIVTQKKITFTARIRRESVEFNKANKVHEVPVEVADDVNRRGKLEKRRIAKKTRLARVAKDQKLGAVEIEPVLSADVVTMLIDVKMKTRNSRNIQQFGQSGSGWWNGRWRRGCQGDTRGSFVALLPELWV